jgi:hypothetical protein
MDDGTVVDTDKATESWEEKRDHDGHNFVGRSSRSQWHDQTLYRSRKGRFYLVFGSSVQGQSDRAEWVSNHEAVRFLLLNERDVPGELQAVADDVTE